MLRYGSTYRSPFNGPRWGAVLAMIAVLFGQAASAFHDPALSGVHPGTGDSCIGSACDFTNSGDNTALDRHDTPNDFSGGDDCEQDCRHCCHHVPMSSPLPSLFVSLQYNQSSLALPTHPFILAADLIPPFHPPRG